MRVSQMSRLPILVAVLLSTSARIMSSRLTASPCAIMPPIESPTKTQLRTCR